ncbi:MAG: hypothetical protein DRJ62_01745 [Thermoprotei archaeon]|nr:MAG: hypothetical protein DRJ62_01745 [Thermoprotei archaeon]
MKWRYAVVGLKRPSYRVFLDEASRRARALGVEDEYANVRVLGADYASFSSRDYALMKGKEIIVDCEVRGFHGQAFTDTPSQMRCKVRELLQVDVEGSRGRALLFSCLNCLMALSGEICGTVHCRRDAPERCGEMLADEIERRFGLDVKIAHIGFQPGHVKATSSRFKEVLVTDLNPENIGKVKFGVKILSGDENPRAIEWADVACITGSAIVNGTLFDLLELCEEKGTYPLVYGVTVKGAAKIMGLPVFCPLSCDSIEEG